MRSDVFDRQRKIGRPEVLVKQISWNRLDIYSAVMPCKMQADIIRCNHLYFLHALSIQRLEAPSPELATEDWRCVATALGLG